MARRRRDHRERSITDFKLDMTMMFAIHDALRRDLERVALMESRSEGWDFFERMLHVHHTAEDDLLWPVVRDAVTDRSDDLELLDEMASEHALIGPLLEAVDVALARGESAPQARADLDARLRAHLTHEEDAALPLIDRTLTEEQWVALGQGAAERVGPDMPRFLPWLLDRADEDTSARVLGGIPEPVQQAYRNEWRSAYANLDGWATKRSVA
jgi:Hemerythrin HHE cation binding domain